MAIGTALLIGGALAAGGSILSSRSQSKAASKAANVAADNTDKNNAFAAQIYGENKSALSPYMETGQGAVGLMNGALGTGDQGAYKNAFANFIGNSDYGFQFGEGANALNSGYAGAGTLQSGAAMKGLEGYRQNLQSGYRGEFNNMIGNQQALGLSGASALAGVGQNYSNTVSANNNNASSAAANAALVKGQNNPFAAGLGALGGSILGGM